MILESAHFLENLNTVVVGVGNDDVLIHSQAKAVWWIELALTRTQLAEFTPTINADKKMHMEYGIAYF